MTNIQIQNESGVTRVVSLDSQSVTIGRASDNDIVLDERNVSRHHAQVRVQGRRVWLAPTSARYGFFLDGELFEEMVELEPGQVVEIGDFKLSVTVRDTQVIVDDDAETEKIEAFQTVSARAVAAGAPESTKPLMSPDVSRVESITGPGVMTLDEAIAKDPALAILKEMDAVAGIGRATDFPSSDDFSSSGNSGIGTWKRAILVVILLLVVAILGYAVYKVVFDSEVMVEPGGAVTTTRTVSPDSATWFSTDVSGLA